MSTKIVKPWGFEIKFTENDLPYTGKILFIVANKRLSLQIHDQKTETLALLSGCADITTGQDKSNLQTFPMEQNKSVTINPGTIHRISTTQDTVIIEVSTPEIGTTRRLEDDFARPDETESMRSAPNRGWNQV